MLHPLTLSLAAFSSPLWEPLTHSLQGLLSNSRTRRQEAGLLEIGKGKRQICVSVAFPSGDALCASSPTKTPKHEPRISSPCLVPAGPPFRSCLFVSRTLHFSPLLHQVSPVTQHPSLSEPRVLGLRSYECGKDHMPLDYLIKSSPLTESLRF